MATALQRYRFTVHELAQMVEAGIIPPEKRVALLAGEIVEMTPTSPRHAACVDRVANQLFGEDFYASSHPGPADVLLLAEVAESSRSHVLSMKVPLYAQAGIPELWLLELEAEKLLVFREPSPQGYKLRRLCTGEDRIAPLAFRELAVTATEIFPRKTTSVR